MHAFDAATAVVPAGPGRWTVGIDADWFSPAGPNGGYLTSILLRAMGAAVDDDARAPRSLTVHFLRAPVEGPAEVTATVERAGRSLTTLTARLEQDGRLCVLALGAFSADFPSAADYADARPPVARPAAEVAPVPAQPGVPTIFERLAWRPAIGPLPFSGGTEARTGGWMSFAEDRPIDAAAAATLMDAWWPSPFVRLTVPVMAPTIDYTLHFRSRMPTADPLAPVLGHFVSRTSAEGFFEEDGELWSADGVLLVQSRQLALMRALPA